MAGGRAQECAVSPRGSGRAGSSRGAPEPAHADNGRSATRRGGRGATPSGQGRIPTGDRPSAAALSRANRTTTRGEEEAPPPSRDSPRTLDGLSRRATEAEWASEWWVRGLVGGRGGSVEAGPPAGRADRRAAGHTAPHDARSAGARRAPVSAVEEHTGPGAAPRAALLAGSGRGCVGLPRAGEGEAREGLGSDGWCALAALCAAVRGRCSSLRGGGRLGPWQAPWMPATHERRRGMTVNTAMVTAAQSSPDPRARSPVTGTRCSTLPGRSRTQRLRTPLGPTPLRMTTRH